MGSIPTLGIKGIMEELTEENRQKQEKKAFYVGLATIFGLVAIVIVVFVFLDWGDKEAQKTEEQIKSLLQPAESAEPNQESAGETGSVAGEASESTTSSESKGQRYIVQSGDTLYEIGKKFNIDWHIIAEANNIEDTTALRAGRQIIIPNE